MMTKVMVERGLDTELDDRLGYDKYGTSSNRSSRNGSTSKILRTEGSQFQLDAPRDREGTLSLNWLKKTKRVYDHGK